MKTQLMAIVNLTDDSFSGDGWLGGDGDWLDGLRAHCAALMPLDHVGAIDVGAESTRPGSTPLAVERELDIIGRTLGALAEVWDRRLSIDTYKPEVARLACTLGASMINDITGAAHPEMWSVAAGQRAELILMHNTASGQQTEQSDRLGTRYLAGAGRADMATVAADLNERADGAARAGVDRVVIDPGLGFGKSVEENFALIRDCERLVDGPHEVLYGPSRKSFLGWRLDRGVEARDPATAATVGYLAERGVDWIRVHNASAMNDHLATLAAISGQ